MTQLSCITLPLLVLSAFLALTNAVELPSVNAKAHPASTPASASWWAQVGNRVYYAPPTSFVGLSQNVSDYYYARGSSSALTDTMKKHLVGSQGTWHIMHLPKGPAMLQMSSTSRSGDRRASLSAFTRLKSGTVLAAGYPSYGLSATYEHPLDSEGQELEKAAVAHITPESTMKYLSELVEFPTRSYQDADASDKVEHYLKKQFEDLGMSSCFQSFENNGKTLVNVIAHVPGTHPGSVTVGAHYDSRPFEGRAPGAEDNGSGVASMLAIAKAFSESEVKPKRSVFFVGFAGEEPGLIGSHHFAQALNGEALPAECTASGYGASLIQQRSRKRSLLSAGDAGHRAIVMDEIGWVSPKLSKQTVNLESFDDVGKNVMEHLRHSADMHNGDSLEVVHNANPYGSDHMSFLDLKMEACLTINGDDEAYPNYHQSTDTIDNVSGDMMAKIAKMNLGGLLRMSQA